MSCLPGRCFYFRSLLTSVHSTQSCCGSVEGIRRGSRFSSTRAGRVLLTPPHGPGRTLLKYSVSAITLSRSFLATNPVVYCVDWLNIKLFTTIYHHQHQTRSLERQTSKPGCRSITARAITCRSINPPVQCFLPSSNPKKVKKVYCESLPRRITASRRKETL